MKLRTILFASALVAATGASALTTTNTFARMPVTATLQNTLLAIPLAGCGEASAEIYVTNLVMTTGLAAETKLLYKDGSTWYAWELKTAGGEWQQMASSTEWGTEITPAAGSTALPCGRGCWLVFPAAGTKIVYLYGQVNEGAVATAIAAGAVGQPVGTLLSLPYETGSINLGTWEPANPAAGDQITIAGGDVAGQKSYKYVAGTGWTTNVVTISGEGKGATYTYQDVHVTDTIPAGTAFIYWRNANSGTVVNWQR